MKSKLLRSIHINMPRESENTLSLDHQLQYTMAKPKPGSGSPAELLAKRVAVAAWEPQLMAEIAVGTAEEVQAIAAKLKELSQEAHARLINLQEAVGCGVLLVRSKQSEDQDVGWNSSERSVSSEFTAWPRGKASRT